MSDTANTAAYAFPVIAILMDTADELDEKANTIANEKIAAQHGEAAKIIRYACQIALLGVSMGIESMAPRA